MSFEPLIAAFAERFLSDRTYQLIVAPALADLHYEHDAGRRRRLANRVAVLRAVAGGLRDDVARECVSFALLMLVPAAYYTFLLVMYFDFVSIEISTDFFVVATLIVVLSFAPVVACFWPERAAAERAD
jgi:hypothetical protein